MRIKTLLLLIFLIPLLFGCEENKEKIEDNSLNEKVVQVEIISIQKEKIEPQISSFGSISFKTKTDISSAVDGIMHRINIEEGDTVKPGMLLATIENIQFQVQKRRAESEIKSAEAALHLTEAKHEEEKRHVKARLISLEKMMLQIRQKKVEFDDIKQTLSNKEELIAVDGITKEELKAIRLQYSAVQTSYETLLKEYEINSVGLKDEDIAQAFGMLPKNESEKENLLINLNTKTIQAEIEVARARLETARTELSSIELLIKELEIKSHSSGILGARYIEEGERIKSGTKLFTTFDNSSVYAVFTVQEDRVHLISAGQVVRVTVPALGNKAYTGTVRVISPTIDPQSGNLSIKAILPNPSLLLLPGMFAHVTVLTGKPIEKLMIPVNTIIKKQGNNAGVFSVVNRRAFMKNIIVGEESGEESGDAIEVIKGIKEGEQLILNPPPILREGMKVEIKN